MRRLINKDKMPKIQTLLLLFIVALLIFGVAYFVPSQNSDVDTLDLCEFTEQDCFKVVSNKKLILTASPTFIKSENEITFQLSANNNPSIKITSAWIEGKEMYMGKIPLFFTKDKAKYEAKTLIGACTEDSMIWTMVLNFELAGETKTVTFDFRSYR